MKTQERAEVRDECEWWIGSAVAEWIFVHLRNVSQLFSNMHTNCTVWENAQFRKQRTCIKGKHAIQVAWRMWCMHYLQFRRNNCDFSLNFPNYQKNIDSILEKLLKWLLHRNLVKVEKTLWIFKNPVFLENSFTIQSIDVVPIADNKISSISTFVDSDLLTELIWHILEFKVSDIWIVGTISNSFFIPILDTQPPK